METDMPIRSIIIRQTILQDNKNSRLELFYYKIYLFTISCCYDQPIDYDPFH